MIISRSDYTEIRIRSPAGLAGISSINWSWNAKPDDHFREAGLEVQAQGFGEGGTGIYTLDCETPLLRFCFEQ